MLDLINNLPAWPNVTMSQHESARTEGTGQRSKGTTFLGVMVSAACSGRVSPGTIKMCSDQRSVKSRERRE